MLDVLIYGIPHHLVKLPSMMNMEFYDIDRMVSRECVVVFVAFTWYMYVVHGYVCGRYID